MKQKVSILYITTIVLGIVSALFLFLDYLALSDIWQGKETDLTLEWTIVSISFIPLILFHILFFS